MDIEPRYVLTKGEDSWFINDNATGESFDTCTLDAADALHALRQHVLAVGTDQDVLELK